jgi:hypothetical protein
MRCSDSFMDVSGSAGAENRGVIPSIIIRE